MDCNNLKNSYGFRILCFGGEGDWLCAGGGGGGTRNISSPLRAVGFYRLCSATFWSLFAFGATFYDISNFKQLPPGNA